MSKLSVSPELYGCNTVWMMNFLSHPLILDIWLLRRHQKALACLTCSSHQGWPILGSFQSVRSEQWGRGGGLV